MSLWIPVAIAAAFFQTLRFAVQKTLAQNTLSAAGATFARFVYSAPLIAVLLMMYMSWTKQTAGEFSGVFWMYGAAGGLAQVLATICVVTLFQARNFAVGITFKKTETILAVLVGFVLLGEGVSLAGFAAIILGVIGVVLLSLPPGARWRFAHLANRASALGLASGLLFAISAVTYRAASLEILAADPVLRAGITLAAVTMMQMLGMTFWLFWRDRAQIYAVWQARRTAIWIGLMSMCGSFCWFLAFTLQKAAYVKALGQVELIFSAIITLVIFHEQITQREWAGIALLGLSVVALVLVI